MEDMKVLDLNINILPAIINLACMYVMIRTAAKKAPKNSWILDKTMLTVFSYPILWLCERLTVNEQYVHIVFLVLRIIHFCIYAYLVFYDIPKACGEFSNSEEFSDSEEE